MYQPMKKEKEKENGDCENVTKLFAYYKCSDWLKKRS